MSEENYGWTSFSRTHWQDIDGRNLYVGRFAHFDKLTVVKLRLLFWALKPTAAMREICRRLNEGESWKKINETTIN